MDKQIPILSKNEYIALELTKVWCGQFGTPAEAHRVLATYEKLLKELEEDN